MKPNLRRLQLDVYPYTFEITTRFADVDPQWHLNNVRIAEYYQEGRVSFHAAMKADFNLERERGSRTLVAHQSIDYLGEVAYPGKVTIGVGIARVGSTSYTIGMGMFQNGKCVGVSDAVLVHATKEGPAPLPERQREVLSLRLLPKDARQ